MKLIYCYIEKFRNIKNQDFHFSMDYRCSFNNRNLSIERVNIPRGETALIDKFSKNITVIVGKTGAGKTNLLQLLGMPEDLRVEDEKYNRYFLVYSIDPDKNLFAIEVNRLIPRHLAYGAPIHGTQMIFFKYENGKITNQIYRDEEEEPDTIIINSFDESSVKKNYFDGLHVDGQFGKSLLNPRILIPYNKVNARVACLYAKEYIEDFPEQSIKREAALCINSINWHFKLNNELDEILVKKEFSFYHDYLTDKRWKSLKDVPKFFDRNVIRTKKLSFKEQFIHDLLTDYALYLRKWADLIKPLDNEQLVLRDRLGMITDLGVKNPHLLPDGKCDDLRTRIDWLCQYIDLHTDEKYGNRGLMWQIGTDILDIADALEKFDDDYFEDGRFIYFLEEMDFEDEALVNLFERMAGYRSDQLGVFKSELLPFEITNLSSGEYQYAKVFGIVDECINTFKNKTAYGSAPENIIFLLDEPETFMHPEMCRKFIYWMSRIMREEGNEDRVQVIMTTHSPFMLSDLLPRQIIKIDFDEYGFCRVIPNDERKTFAGDIHSIMANQFFLDYTIGENSRIRIEALMKLLNENENVKNEVELSHIRSFLSDAFQEIGDLIIRQYLQYKMSEENHVVS